MSTPICDVGGRSDREWVNITEKLIVWDSIAEKLRARVHTQFDVYSSYSCHTVCRTCMNSQVVSNRITVVDFFFF